MPYPNRLDLTIYSDLRDSESILEFPGTVSEYIIRNPCIFPNAAFTFECWLETDDTGKTGVVASYARTGELEEVVIKDYADVEIIINGNSSGSTGIAVNDGSPHQVSVSWLASTGATVLYVDAKPRWTGVISLGASLTTGGAFVIGQEQGAVGGSFVGASSFLGKVWDVRLWDDVRTEAEILENMNRRLTGSEIGLHFYWMLDEGVGTNADDGTANNFDGTINGTGVWTTTETPFWTDLTDYVIPESLGISNVLGDAVDTVYLTIESWAGQEPQEWDEIVIFDGSIRIFGGYVTSINRSEGEGATVKHNLGCSDYAIYLDHVVHKQDWEDQSDKDIIVDLIQAFAPWIGIGNIAEVLEYPKFRMNRQSIRKIINSFADGADADWYIDANREMYFFQAQTADAPFGLSDDPDYATEFPFYGLVKHEGGSDIANLIEVVGGNYNSDDATFFLAGTGEDERVVMPFKMHPADGESALLVWRNDGTEITPSWTAMTVKVGFIDQLGGANEVLHYFQDKVLEQQNAWPQLPNAVKVFGQYEIPLRVRVRDKGSFAFYKKWFYDFVNDPDITDKSTALIIAKGELAERSMGKTSVTLHVAEPGLRAGQKIPLKSVQFGIDQDFIIKRVSADVYAYGRVRYGLSLGVWNDDLVDILMELWGKRDDMPLWRDDETLDELLETTELLYFDETTPAPTSTIDPYRWGAEASGNTPLIWDFGSWG